MKFLCALLLISTFIVHSAVCDNANATDNSVVAGNSTSKQNSAVPKEETQPTVLKNIPLESSEATRKNETDNSSVTPDHITTTVVTPPPATEVSTNSTVTTSSDTTPTTKPVDTTTPKTPTPPTPTTPATSTSNSISNSTTEASSSTPSSTPANNPSSTPKPCPPSKFNGSSFIGGIVLTLGLMAISFIAYKFYKARNERNYHTL